MVVFSLAIECLVLRVDHLADALRIPLRTLRAAAPAEAGDGTDFLVSLCCGTEALARSASRTASDALSARFLLCWERTAFAL